LVGYGAVLTPRIVIHNKGCKKEEGQIYIRESLKPGWTPANPQVSGDGTEINSSVDLENNIIEWYVQMFDPREYTIVTYQLKAPPAYGDVGWAMWNASYKGVRISEPKKHTIQTANYSGESHVEFFLTANQLEEFPWPETRSIMPNYAYNYTLTAKNVGNDVQNWTVYLPIPSYCNILHTYNGSAQGQTAVWNLTDLGIKSTKDLIVELNCTKVGTFEFKPFAVRNTTAYASYVDFPGYRCTGQSCTSEQTHSFQSPGQNYERLVSQNITFNFTSSGDNVSIAQFALRLDGKPVYENYWLGKGADTKTLNLSEELWGSQHTLRLESYSTAMYGANTSLNISSMGYTWEYGRLFNESQRLFADIKVYEYIPLMQNSTLYINGNSSRTTGGWGEEFKFSLWVRDRFGRNVTVWAWHKIIGQGWKLIGNTTCVDCLSWTQLNFTYDYLPTDINTWQFKFNATNADGNNTLDGFVYVVEKDDVTLSLKDPVNTGIVNRSASTRFATRIYDTDNKTYPDGTIGKTFISIFDQNTFESAPSPLSASAGWLNRTITNAEWCADEGKYYLGNHSWYTATTGDQYIKDNSSYKWNFTLKGTLSNTITKLIGENVSKEYNSTFTIEGYVTTDCGVTTTTPTVRFNVTHGGYYWECIGTPVGSVYQCNFPTASAPYGWYNITMESNQTLYWNGLATHNAAFYLASVPDVNASADKLEAPWGASPWNFTSYVTDQDNDTDTLRFWLKKGAGSWNNEKTFSSSHNNNARFYYERTFSCPAPNDIGTWYFKTNVTDTSGYWNETPTIQFNVTKEPIWIMHLSGAGKTLNRSNTLPDSQTRLAVRLYDYVLDINRTDILDTNVNFWINGSSFTSTLNSSGKNYYYDYNPSCSFPAGNLTWKANFSGEACYADNSSINFNIVVMGYLNGTLLVPDGNTNYTQGELFNLTLNLTDDCGQVVGDANVWFNLTNTRTGDSYRCPDTGYAQFNGSVYLCQVNTSTFKGGWFNITANATKPYHWPDVKTYGHHYFQITPVSLSNQQHSAPGDGGWGENHTFSVVVDHYADVQVCLLEDLGTGEQITECKLIPQPTNQLVTFNRTYDCGPAGSFISYRFNASEPGVPSTLSNTTQTNHFVQKDDVQIIYVKGNLSEVNRSSGYTQFILLINDTDRGKPAAYIPTYDSPRVRFFAYNGTQFIEDGNNVTNSSGYVEYRFDPDCRYDVGPKKWYGSTTLDACYKTVNSEQYNTTIWGDIAPNITYPNGETFYRITSIVINVTTDYQDECGREYLNTSANYTLISRGFGNHFQCQSVDDYKNGTQVCHFDGSFADQGYYDVNITAWGVPYHNNATYRKNYTFRLIQLWIPPVLQNETVTFEQDGGWGENFTFSVNVSDENAEDVNVSLWLSPDNSTWTLIETKTCKDCGTVTQLDFYYWGYDCSDIGTRYFKFNATDSHNTTDRIGRNFTITKDDVQFIYEGASAGNDSVVNRWEGQLLKIRVYDPDNHTYLPDSVATRFWVTTDGSSWLKVKDSTTNNTYTNVTFTPNCNWQVGPQKWKSGTIGNACYKDSNSTDYLKNTIVGYLTLQVTQPAGDTYYEGQNATLRGNITDECGTPTITDATVWFNVSHASFGAQCAPVVNEGNGYYNCTLNVTGTPGGWYAVSMNATRQYYNNASTAKTNAYFHEIAPVLSGEYVTPNESYWGTTRTFYVNVTDDDDTVTVKLWHRKWPSTAWSEVATQYCSDCINKTLTFTRTYTQTEIGTWEWRFTSTDGDLTFNTSIHNLTVFKRNVIVEYYRGNESNVTRFGSNTTLLTLVVKDAVSGSPIGQGLDGGFWVTVNGTDWGSKILTTTETGSYLNISFDPGCAYSVGRQKWKGGVDESTFYYAGNSSEFNLTIYTIINGTINIPNGDHIIRGNSLGIYGDVRDECGYVPGATAKYRLYKGIKFIPSPDPAQDLNNGTYNSSWDTTGAALGWYNITMNISKQYHQPDYYTLKKDAFYLGSGTELRNPWVDTAQQGWGHNYTFKVEVRDVENDVTNVSLWYSNSSSGPWKLVGWQTKQTTIFENVTFRHVFDCQDYFDGPTIYYKFRAVDSNNFEDETTPQTITLEQDDLGFIIVSGAGASINREGNNPFRFIVSINDTDYGQLVGAGLNGTYYFTYDSSVFDGGHNTTTNSTGQLVWDHDPDCSYTTGVQLWYVSMRRNACYKNTDMGTSTYSVIGQLKNNLVAPAYLSQFNVTDGVLIRLNVTSDCANEGGINDTSLLTIKTEHNSTSSQYSCTPVGNEGDGYYNCTWDSTGKPEGNYSIILHSERGSYNPNTTVRYNWFWLENLNTSYSNPQVDPPLGGWGETFQFNVSINDTEGDTVNCTLWVNTSTGWVWKGYDTITGTAGTPTAANCSVSVSDFTCGEQGTAQFKWTIDDGTNVLNTTITSGPTIEKDDTSSAYFLGNASFVNRSNGYTKLIVRILDTDRGVYVESNGTLWVNRSGQYFPWTNRSNSTGHLIVNFDPSCSYGVGVWQWFGGAHGDACYKDSNTTEFTIVNITG
ncbi:MAG: hypothetical protein D6706_18540, partial [Chloroflexi bacterium]